MQLMSPHEPLLVAAIGKMAIPTAGVPSPVVVIGPNPAGHKCYVSMFGVINTNGGLSALPGTGTCSVNVTGGAIN